MIKERYGAIAPVLLVVLLTSALYVHMPAFASDGRIEINHARALKGSVTPGDTPGYPVMIGQSGSYILTGSLSIPNQNTAGIHVSASNVTIDLNGFEIAGPTNCTGVGSMINCSPTGTGDGIHIQSSRNVTVRNGTIRGAGGSGIRKSGGGSLGTQIIDVRIRHCGDDGISGGSLIVTGTHVFENQNAGMSVFGAKILDSVASGNGDSGIEVQEGSLVTRCVSTGNGGHGISAFDSVAIIDNSIVGNEGLGITCMHFFFFDASYSSNVIENNGMGTLDVNCQEMGSNICDGDTTCP